MEDTELLRLAPAMLASTAERWQRLTAALPRDLLTRAPAPDEWSAADCLRHLCDVEQAVFPTRVRAFLAGRDFPAFDPDSQERGPAADPDLVSLAAEFARLRAENLTLLATLRTIAARMIALGVWRVPVVSRANPRQVVGILSQRELLRAREHLLEEERRRERLFRLRLLAPGGERPAVPARRTDVAIAPEHGMSNEVVATNGAHPAPTAGIEEQAAPGANGTAAPESTMTERTGSVSHGDTRPGPEDV